MYSFDPFSFSLSVCIHIYTYYIFTLLLTRVFILPKTTRLNGTSIFRSRPMNNVNNIIESFSYLFKFNFTRRIFFFNIREKFI